VVGTVGLFKTRDGRVRLGWRLLLFILLFALLSGLLSVIAPSRLPLQSLPVLLGAVGAGWIMLALDRRGLGALGFYLGPESGRETALGLGAGLAVGLGVLCGMGILGAVQWSTEGGSWGSYLEVAGASLWLFALPAAAEEALLRGYVLQALAEGWGSLKALWLTSAVFAALHLGNPNLGVLGLVNIGLAGLWLGVIYLKTASLWWASGAHLGWNWAHGFVGDLPVSGLDLVDTPILVAGPSGPSWLSGGAFGPEGSLVATVGLGLVTVALWKSSWLRPGDRAKRARPLVLDPWASTPASWTAPEAGAISTSGRES
jgi:membrane protease YdiL (CAAX protease family)